MKPLSKGDTCRVRLNTGEVVEAVYDERASYGPHHWVVHDGESLLQTVGSTEKLSEGVYYGRCRFVGPSCDLIPVVVSNAT